MASTRIRYWEVGESDRDFRYNNYLSRYHWRHIDLMDVLSGYGASGRASLELAAQLIGLPGKLGIGGAQVWPAFRRGELGAIRDYCETDVLNTYLIYSALRADARRARCRGVPEGARGRRGEARAVRSAALEAVPRALADDAACGLTKPLSSPRSSISRTTAWASPISMAGACSSPMRCPASASRWSCANGGASCKKPISSACSSRRPTRVTPGCEYFGRCGGCALQHLAHPAQVSFKQRVVAETLKRIGRVEPEEWLPAVVSQPWHYRRRARLGVKYVAGKNRVLVGFRERAGPYITDMRHCPVLMPPVDGLLGELAELIERSSVKDRLPQIEAAVADDAVALVLRVLDEPTRGRQRGVSRVRRPPRHRPLLAARRARHGRAARSCAAAALSLARVRPHARVLADGLRAGQRGHQRRARVDGHSLGSRRADGPRARSVLRARQFQLAARAASGGAARRRGRSGARRACRAQCGREWHRQRALRDGRPHGVGLEFLPRALGRRRARSAAHGRRSAGRRAPCSPAAPHRLRIVPPGDARARRAGARRAAWV